MNARIKWTASEYKQALIGYSGVPGLRKLIKGFTKDDGYDIRKIKSWDKNMKRRVRRWYKIVRELEAQPRLYVKLNSKNRKPLIKASHPGVGSLSFNYALVPSVPGATGKASVKNGVVKTSGKTFDRYFVPLDQNSLIENSEDEIARCVEAMPSCRVFYVQADANLITRGFDANSLVGYVNNLMYRYDGFSPLTEGRHRGDNPAEHGWQRWMSGIVGFSTKGGVTDTDALRATVKAIEKAKKARRKKL